jgi:hypothetical protein
MTLIETKLLLWSVIEEPDVSQQHYCYTCTTRVTQRVDPVHDGVIHKLN